MNIVFALAVAEKEYSLLVWFQDTWGLVVPNTQLKLWDLLA